VPYIPYTSEGSWLYPRFNQKVTHRLDPASPRDRTRVRHMQDGVNAVQLDTKLRARRLPELHIERPQQALDIIPADFRRRRLRKDAFECPALLCHVQR
jgi:hypothetical protein